ncbi:MAG TPA: ABC transporter ATP-binding protein [Polyangiaceae bacterium]|nr:ABC transporter ATP-binding protein [Polyangiaceae bacterium]
MSTALLKLERVEKRFGGICAIARVSFELAERQIFGLIGPNGAGKTTLFNCITGHYTPDAGDVRFRGRSLVGKKPHQIALAGIARTFQNVRLFAEMSVIDNVLVSAHHRARAGMLGAVLRSAAYAREERALFTRAKELLELFELAALEREPAASLPYGSQRRLEIARALMLEPKLLLLDEPAAGLNSHEADKLTEQIKWLRDRFGLSVLLVEHNMRVVMGASEYVHCLDHGETIAAGTPAYVREHPAVLEAYLGQETAAAERAP